MNRRFLVSLVSHVGVAVVGALIVGTALASWHTRQHWSNPDVSLGALLFNAKQHPEPALRALDDSTLDPKLITILRLHVNAVAATSSELPQAYRTRASEICERLDWPACDTVAIAAMGGQHD